MHMEKKLIQLRILCNMNMKNAKGKSLIDKKWMFSEYRALLGKEFEEEEIIRFIKQQ